MSSLVIRFGKLLFCVLGASIFRAALTAYQDRDIILLYLHLWHCSGACVDLHIFVKLACIHAEAIPSNF